MSRFLLSISFFILSFIWSPTAKADLDPLIPQLVIPQVSILYNVSFAGATPILTIPLYRGDGRAIESMGFGRLRDLTGELRVNLCEDPGHWGAFRCDPFSGTGWVGAGAFSHLSLAYENGNLVAKISLQGVSPNDLLRVWISSWDGTSTRLLSASPIFTYQFVADIQTMKHLLSFSQDPSGYEVAKGFLVTQLMGTQNMEATQLRKVTPHLSVKFCGNGNCDKYCSITSSWTVGCSLAGGIDYQNASVRLIIGPISAGNTQSDSWAGVEYGSWIIAQSVVIPSISNPLPPPQPPDAATVGVGVPFQPLPNAGTVQGSLQQMGAGALQVAGGGVQPPADPVPPPVIPAPVADPGIPEPPDMGGNPPPGGGDVDPPGLPVQPGTGQDQGGSATSADGGSSSGCSLQPRISSAYSAPFFFLFFPILLALLSFRRSKQL